jgi:tRNA dimethylallyltransferase
MTSSAKPKIVVIVGQTGSGKTSLSLEIAKKFNGEVINADSRQVYKGLDIGTEKISKDDMNGVPHHLLDIKEPSEAYTAVEFASDASQAVTEITQRHRLPIIAGGTFFYIDTLLCKTGIPNVPPNPALREELEAKDTQTLFSELEVKDPERASSVDRHNKRRLMRALEILHVLPKVPKAVVKENPYDALIIGISVDKKILRERLRARAEKALERGLVEEVEDLLAEGVTRARLSEIGLEYRLVLEFLEGTVSKEELIQKLEEKNWQYAKRQNVWLKRDSDVRWFQREDTDGIFAEITTFLAN